MGERGVTHLTEALDLAKAEVQFQENFKDKTQNNWMERWQPEPGTCCRTQKIVVSLNRVDHALDHAACTRVLVALRTSQICTRKKDAACKPGEAAKT